jgi:6-phosphogluconolactonase/glucosamine-6-phosphate isomerase/deaminase
MEIITTASPETDAAAALSKLLRNNVTVPILLMLSGGSALGWLSKVDVTVLDERMTITTLDERFSTDPAVNNFLQLQQTPFFLSAQDRGVHVVPTSVTEFDTIEAATSRFELALKSWKAAYPHGMIFATMGIGADGHVAGILPEKIQLLSSDDSWVKGYHSAIATSPYKDRITVTGTFLRECVHEAIVVVVGDTKKSVILELADYQRGLTQVEKKPMAVLLEMKHVEVYTDTLL